METPTPLVQLSLGENPWTLERDVSLQEEEEDSPPKRWFDYLPVCGALAFGYSEGCHSHLLTVMLLMLFAPHPSWLVILVHHHILTLKSYGWFVTHLLISYTLMFLACTSLIVCLARDPGPVPSPEGTEGDDEETSLAEALMAPAADSFNSPGKWCKKCWAAKPERTHHCSICRRCVLKMGTTPKLKTPHVPALTEPGRVDHHCQWMANKCIVNYLTL